MNLLSGHNNIKVVGEIFNLDKLSHEDVRDVLENSIAYFNKKLSCDSNSGIKAIGAKVFYEHLTDDYFSKFLDMTEATPSVRERIVKLQRFLDANFDNAELDAKFKNTWDYLASDQSISIIHLKRKNMLKSIVSLKRAYLTDEWMKLGKIATSENIRMTVEYEECLNFFNKVTLYEKRYSQLFKKHKWLEVVYEDLDNNRDKVINNVTDFLSLDSFIPYSIMKKQSVVSIPEVLLNFYELKERFQNTQWSVFFEEPHNVQPREAYDILPTGLEV